MPPARARLRKLDREMWMEIPAAQRSRRGLCRASARALRVGRVDAENADLGGKKSEFLGGQLKRPVVGMGFDIGIELRRSERAADHVAFQLGHVDAVCCEAAE